MVEQTTAAVAKRLEAVHPKAKTKVRPTALYVSNNLQEYEIKLKQPFWIISPYKGGQLPDKLLGLYQTYRLAEVDLITYLRENDRRGNAIWPGK